MAKLTSEGLLLTPADLHGDVLHRVVCDVEHITDVDVDGTAVERCDTWHSPNKVLWVSLVCRN